MSWTVKCACFTEELATRINILGALSQYYWISSPFLLPFMALSVITSLPYRLQLKVQAHTFSPFRLSAFTTISHRPRLMCRPVIFASGCPRPFAPGAKIIHHILPLCPPCQLWRAPALSQRWGHMWVPILSSGGLRVVTRARRSGEADIRTCMHKQESIKPHVKQTQHVLLPFPMMESFYSRWPRG